MSYMTVNGIRIPTASSKKRRTPVGRRRVAANGRVETSRRADRLKDEWDVGTIPLLAAEANALEAILAGRAHVWDLNGSWSSSGGAGVRANNSLSFRFAAGPYADATFARVASGGSVDLMADYGAAWTVLVRRLDTTWKHYGFRSTGNMAVDGAIVPAVTILPWFSLGLVTDDIILSGKNDANVNANLDVAQVVFIPEVLPDTLLIEATAWIDRRWGASPVLDISGDFTARTHMLARASVSTGALVPGPQERRVLVATIRQAEGA